MQYSELIQMTVEEVAEFVSKNPTHIAGNNALRELEREHKSQKKMQRMGKKTATISGKTKSRYSASMRRTPTDRELR
jgi:hypothetical protein